MAMRLSSAYASETPAPISRTILALYDSRYESRPAKTRIHQFAEMPLNHLGLVVKYHDISQGIPSLKSYPNLRGIISWWVDGANVPDELAYAQWLNASLKQGERVVVMGNHGFGDSDEAVRKEADQFFTQLGLQNLHEWVSLTYDVEFQIVDKEMLEFERSLPNIVPEFGRMRAINPDDNLYLLAHRKGDEAARDVLAMTSPKGGYVAESYAAYHYYDEKLDKEFRQWIINPFRFFAAAFATDDLPKPDTTTLSGRRIYYSHIDGDGWNNVSLINSYRKTESGIPREILSSEVILREVVEPYPDLPVTVSPIAADLNPDWGGHRDSQSIAREFFALPWVFMGSHTYSHPFDWDFFADGNAEKEEPYLSKYSGKVWGSKGGAAWLTGIFTKQSVSSANDVADYEAIEKGYAVPRGFAVEPFSIEQEVQGSADYINQFAPEGKRVEIMMWSGDTTPFEDAIKQTRLAGIANINGGDTRFDQEYFSHAWVAPLARQVGNERQIYASNSNENTYTELWTDRYYGFQYLQATLDNTESPIRLKPLHVYYHMYSGERQASLNALLKNLEYARSHAVIPITSAEYSKIVNGFYDAELIPYGKQTWKVLHRGKLGTIRFDTHAATLAVDYRKSKGVIGAIDYQDSLYVALDAATDEPLIVLTDKEKSPKTCALIESRWNVQNLKRQNFACREWSFDAQGFGMGEMQWQVPENGAYEVIVMHAGEEILHLHGEIAKNYVLPLRLDTSAIEPVSVTIRKES